MSFEQIQFLANFRQFHGVKQQVTKILADDTLSREEKMKQLLTNESLKMCQGNQKLVDFLCEKESLELLIYYSVAVPKDPANRDESYKQVHHPQPSGRFPFVAQELLCQSSMIAENLVEGGLIENTEETQEDEDEDEYESDGTDEREEDEPPKQEQEKVPSKIGLKPKFNNKLTIKTDDDDEEPKDPEADEKKKDEEDFDALEEKEAASEEQILEDRKKQYEVNEEDDAKEDADHDKIEIKVSSQEENGDVVEPEEEDATGDAIGDATGDSTGDAAEDEREEDVEESKEKEKKPKKSLKFSSKKLKKGTGKALEEKPKEASSPEEANEEEEPSVSDDFLKMKLENTAVTEDKEEADFERDEDDTKNSFQNPRSKEEQEQAEKDNTEADLKDVDENVDSTEEGASAQNPSKVKIQLFMRTGINSEQRKKKKKAKKEGEGTPRIKANSIQLLDRLFSFIGVNSSQKPMEAMETLNIFADSTNRYSSRNTAGTIERLPGPLSPEEKEEISARSARDTPKMRNSFMDEEGGLYPELLPVTCGYFGNIVRQLLVKQRKPVLRYLLKDTKAEIFGRLLNNIQHHSLSELLVELMQVSLEKYDTSTRSTSINDDDSDEEQQPVPPSESDPDDLIEMKQNLIDGKKKVIRQLLAMMSHINHDDIERALNISSTLIDIIEIADEKTLSSFFFDRDQYLGYLLELALDPSNALCQKYLLQVLVAIIKKLKASPRNQPFKDLEEKNPDDGAAYNFYGVQITEAMQKFNPLQHRCRNILDFLGLARENDLVSSLLLLLSTNECNYSGDRSKEENSRLYIENQYGDKVRRLGPTRLAALELLYHFLLLLFPSFGDMFSFQSAMEQKQIPEPPHPDIGQSRYLSKNKMRHLLKTLLYIIREHSYCNMALELCAFILAEVRTMFDIVDIVTLQKFVIQEFRERHLKLRKLVEEGNDEEVSRFKLDHMNMQSAQVNQIALQLKEKDAMIHELYSSKEYLKVAESEQLLNINYFDLITEKDDEFWKYLMKRDLVRIEKLQALGLGENHNFDVIDGDSADEEQPEEVKAAEEEQKPVADEMGDDEDHDDFLAQMMRQRKEEKDDEDEKEKAAEQQEFQDNNYWNSHLLQDQLDVDELLEDYD